MNRHHQSPSFIEGYSQDVTEVSGGHEGIKKIIQSWGANCTLKLETTMVTTMDPNDKFTKPHDIPMEIHQYFMEILMNSPQIFHIPMVFLWYSYDIPMNSPQIFETPPDPWPSCPAPARLCARCSPRRSPGTRTDRCHRAPVHAEKPEGLSLGWEEPDKPWVFMNVLPKTVGKP